MNNKFKRILAAAIDFCIICFASVSLVCVFTLGDLYVTPYSITIYLFAFFILLLTKDCIFKNASIGKLIFKLKVVKNNGTNLMFLDVVKRNLTLIILLPLELALIVLNDCRIGDIWAKTHVNDTPCINIKNK